MSWSILFIGTPDKVIDALQAESANLTGESKTEYDAVKDSLIVLCSNNFNNDAASPPLVHLEASGHGYAREDGPVNRNVQVKLTPLYGRLV